MTKRRSTKRALLSSVVALLLCFSMLLGSTFAWFTDSVVSANNVITAGNLDIDVQYTLDGRNWKSLDGAQDLFKKGLWEPGHTEVVALKIENKGSLALKYEANMNIVDETIGKTKNNADIKLSDILTVSTLTIEAAGTDPLLGWDIAAMTLEKAFEGENNIGWGTPVAFNAGNVLESDQSLFVGSTQYVFVKVDMAETVGNEANHDGTNIPKIVFGINVLATQYTYESDSFDNQYDKDAEYQKTVEVSTLEDLTNAIADAASGDVVKLTEDISTTYLKVEKPVILDLNGKTLTTDAWGGLLLKNGASVKNGTIIHKDAVAAIKAWNAGKIEDVVIEITKDTANNHITGIAVQEGSGNSVGTIKNVTITGASQGIEVKNGSSVNYLENVTVSARTIGANEGTALQINGGAIGKATNCKFTGDVYGVNMLLKGEYDVALELEKCKVSGTTAAIYAHDEPGIPNTTNCSLTLTYDSETELNNELKWEFEDECKSVVTLNKPN